MTAEMHVKEASSAAEYDSHHSIHKVNVILYKKD